MYLFLICDSLRKMQEKECDLVFLFLQNNHEHPRVRCVHHLSGAASYVWWHEAGSGGNSALRHRPLLEPQEPHRPTGPHLPGHTPPPVPSQVLSSADQRVSVSVTRTLPWKCWPAAVEGRCLSGVGPSVVSVSWCATCLHQKCQAWASSPGHSSRFMAVAEWVYLTCCINTVSLTTRQVYFKWISFLQGVSFVRFHLNLDFVLIIRDASLRVGRIREAGNQPPRLQVYHSCDPYWVAVLRCCNTLEWLSAL